MTAAKKLSAILTACTLFLTMIHLVLGQGFSYSLEWKQDGANLWLNIAYDAGSENAKTIVSFYDEASRLIDVKEYDVNPDESVSRRIMIEVPEGAESAKAFVWDSLSGMKPLSETAETALGAELREGFAVLDGYTYGSDSTFGIVTLYTEEGVMLSRELDNSSISMTDTEGLLGEPGKTLSGDEIDEYLMAKVYLNGKDGQKTPIYDRIVEYELSSYAGKVTSLGFSDIQRHAEYEEFDERSNSLGTLRMNEDTVVINAIEYCDRAFSGNVPDYTDLDALTIAGFVEDVFYTAYAYGERSTDGAYPFVVVTAVSDFYNKDTEFAVVADTPKPDYDEETGEEIFSLKAYYQNSDFTEEGNTLTIKADAEISGSEGIGGLKEGDIIVFDSDAGGRINRIDVLATAEELGIGENSSYEDAFKIGTNVTRKINIPDKSVNWTGEWFDDEGLDWSKDITRILYGPVVDKMSSFFTLGNIAYAGEISVDDGDDGVYTGRYTDLSLFEEEGGFFDIDIDTDTNVYVYDFSAASIHRLGIGKPSDIMSPDFPNGLLYNYGDFIPWDNLDPDDCGVCFAFVKVVEYTATDVLVILPG